MKALCWLYSCFLVPGLALPSNDTLIDQSGIKTEEIAALNHWSMNCPHVTSSSANARLTVTWTLDQAIWLKVDDGRPRITNRLSSLNQRTLNHNHILRVTLNDHRYKFYHDEVVGAFSVTVDSVRAPDAGLWECHVTIYRKNGIVQQLSTARHLVVTGDTITDAPFKKKSAPTQRRVVIRRDEGEEYSNLSWRTIPNYLILFSVLFLICRR